VNWSLQRQVAPGDWEKGDEAMKRLLVVAVAVTVAAVAIASLTFSRHPIEAQTSTTVHSVPPADFAAAAFDAPHGPPTLTSSQAIAVVGRDVHLKGLSVTAAYTGWTAQGLYHRPPGVAPNPKANSPGAPLGHMDVWKVTVGLTTTDPGGGGACPAGSTASTCPSLRVYHHMVYLVDDATAKIIASSPY
jgi:hypothetical protein